MPLFRKRPIVVQADQWFQNGDHPQDDVFRPFEDTGVVPSEPREGKVVRYFRHPGICGHSLCQHCQLPMHDHGWIDTPEGGHTVCPSDWIITGVAGERYPCKNKIFQATYDLVCNVVVNPDVATIRSAGDDGIVPEDDTDDDDDDGEPQLVDPDEEEFTCPHCQTEYTGEEGDCPNCPDGD